METEPQSGEVRAARKGRPVAPGREGETSRTCRGKKAIPAADISVNTEWRRGEVTAITFVNLRFFISFGYTIIRGGGIPVIK